MKESEWATSTFAQKQEDFLGWFEQNLSGSDYRHIIKCRKTIDKIFETDTDEEIKYKVANYNCFQILQLLPNHVDKLKFNEDIHTIKSKSIDLDEEDIIVWDINTLDKYIELWGEELR